MINTSEILKAWEENQRAGWAIADALKHLKDDPSQTEESRGAALLAIDDARRRHNKANAILQPAQKQLANSLQP